MSLRNVLLLIVAIVVAASAVMFARSWLDSERAAIEAMRVQPKEEADKFVLVAARNLSRGSFVKAEDLRWQAWPDETLDEAYVERAEGTPEDFAGAVVRYPVVSGEPITSARIVRPGERGFLAAALEPGKRAVTIPVNVTSGVAGFVFPGDSIDLLLTMRFKEGKSSRYVTETLMPEIRVIAIDQRLNDQQEGARVAKTMTFEVSPKEVEMINVARRLGAISLSLRSLTDVAAYLDYQEPDGPEGEIGIAANDELPEERGRGFTWDREVSAILAARANQTRVTIIRGGSRGSVAADKPKDEEDEAEGGDQLADDTPAIVDNDDPQEE